MLRMIRVKILALGVLISILLVTGSTLVEAAPKPPVTPDGSTVCYFASVGFINISNTRQTVTAQVLRIFTGQSTTQTYSFSLDGGKSGTFHIEFLIPDPKYTYQILWGTWFSNPNMIPILGSQREGYLDLEDCTGHVFGDGRINDGENEKAAPVVAYCEDDGIGVYDIDPQSQGNLVFRVSYDDISDGIDEAKSSGQAVALGSADDDTLYALNDGHLQLSGPEQFTGKPYNYIFAGDFCG